jgi:hypothetical protein
LLLSAKIDLEQMRMITAITIENFKGIRERVRIPIKPITLLFGPNSGGKSTIIQAIHYAREIFERRNLDCKTTETGGRFVELGGFRNFVHARDIQREVTLCFEFAINGKRSLPRFESLKGGRNSWDDLDALSWPLNALVEFSVAWNGSSAYVSKYSVDFNGQRFASVSCSASPDRAWCRPLALNFEHPVFEILGSKIWALDAELENEDGPGALAKVRRGEEPLSLAGPDALPNPNDHRGEHFELLFANFGGRGDCFQIGYEFLDHVLAHLIAGPCVVLADQLRDFRYLGPLRELPGRSYEPPNLPDPRRWAGGLAAWDLLHTSADIDFLEKINFWLEDRLDCGYRIRRKTKAEIDVASDLFEEIRRGWVAKDQLERERQVDGLETRSKVSLVQGRAKGVDGIEVRFQEIGVGISQVMPIVVGCLDSEISRLFAVEQPELHLHPRLQCELADVLIHGALTHTELKEEKREDAEGNTEYQEIEVPSPHIIFVETHSEHLILRILRRIRETSRGRPHDGIPVTPNDLAVVYVSQKEGQSLAQTIRVDEHGELVDNWPDQFFELDFYERVD